MELNTIFSSKESAEAAKQIVVGLYSAIMLASSKYLIIFVDEVVVASTTEAVNALAVRDVTLNSPSGGHFTWTGSTVL